jgi:histidyl-tRNA synthetase
MASPIQSLRGTRDILPEEAARWQWLEAIARQTLGRSGFREIRTPIIEETALFARGIGEATDVVGKEMYSFSRSDDGKVGTSITLRPENTAGVVRSYIQNKLGAQGDVQRLWYTGPMFRYERPQGGRQRQFHQLGAETLGSADPRADAELIALATDLLTQFGLKNLTLALNSVGEFLTPHVADLDPDSQDRLTRNPLRILDSKNPKTQAIVQNAPTLVSYLSPTSRAFFDRVQQVLTDLGILYHLDTNLVRGLDYYSHTAFEIQSADLGAQSTVCGGGRYDGLVEQLGGAATPAVGWAMGLERLIILLDQLGEFPAIGCEIYVVSRGEAAESRGLVLAQQLRQQGFTVQLDLSGSPFGKQFKRADRSGAAACLILGDSEVEQGTVNLKWLATGEQSTIAQAELLDQPDRLRQQLAAAVGGGNPSLGRLD